MAAQPGFIFRFRPSLALILLTLFLGVLWLAGGASRADALGQVVVRFAAWAVLVIFILAGKVPSFREAKATLWLLIAALALALLQLIPLPPDLWLALPGRERFAEAMAASGQAQPWRPWSIVPSATVNAASSLIVPLVIVVLVVGLRKEERPLLPILLLILITASALFGLLQFSGAAFNNPLVNDSPGEVSGTFANRNHFALLIAFGCMLAPWWAFSDRHHPGWRGPVALGLVLLFVLTILASGSRAGVLLGVMALGLGLILIGREIGRTLRHHRRWVSFAFVGGILAVILTFVLISVAADRAVSIDRVLADGVGQDMRMRAIPTILTMIETYFPAGSGLGGFDPIYRIHEPFEHLTLRYLNHAHNDFLEVVLDAGLPGLMLLVAAVLWWAGASARAWRAGSSLRHALPKLGSAMLLLVLIASIFDYPARTPTIMAMIVVASLWLGGAVGGRQGAALPKSGQPL